MYPFAFKNAYIESRIQDVYILSGTLSRVTGLKFAGFEGSPFLCMRIVQAFFQARGVNNDNFF